jgi:hypothetical protein
VVSGYFHLELRPDQMPVKDRHVLSRPYKGSRPEFVRLLLGGAPVADAADRLKLNHHTAANWAEKVAANNPEAMAQFKCPCGKPIRHRGSCAHRLAKHLRAVRMARGAA